MKKICVDDIIKQYAAGSCSTHAEFDYIFNSFNNIERNLLISLLNEERENLEPHTQSSEYASSRCKVIDSILQRFINC